MQQSLWRRGFEDNVMAYGGSFYSRIRLTEGQV